MKCGTRIALLFVLVLPCIGLFAAATDDGFYEIAKDGPVVRTVSGKEIHLGSRFEEKGIRLRSLYSESNDNEQFSMSIEKNSAFSTDAFNMAFCVSDYCTMFSSSGSGKSNGVESFGIGARLPRPAAEAFGKYFGVSPTLRTHPGHMLATRFIPSKDVFARDAAIPVTLEIKNVGASEVTFQVGGQNRGARDNQFGFTAYLRTAVLDTGNPQHLGGLSYSHTLKPGEIFKKEVDLQGWFKFPEPDESFLVPGAYSLTGTYALRFLSADGFAVWEDFVAARFYITVK